jgi:RNA polymerase sigma factor (sigma-70 family)
MREKISSLLKGYDIEKEEFDERVSRKNEEDRNVLLMANLKLVAFIARKRSTNECQFEDNFHAGVVGLATAIQKCDKGCSLPQFKKFIYMIISQEITRDNLRINSAASLSESTLKYFNDYTKGINELLVKLQREPTDDEICDYLGISKSSLFVRKQADLSALYLNTCINSNGDGNFVDVLIDRFSPCPSSNMNKRDMACVLKNSIDNLGSVKANIIREKYYKGKTNRDIGICIGKSAQRVQQMMVESLREIRFYLKEHGVDVCDLKNEEHSIFGGISKLLLKIE